jgi:hypothetical protein
MENAEYPEDGPLLSQIGEAKYVTSVERKKVMGLFFARTRVRVAILLATLGAAYGTFRLPINSFPQSLLCNLSAGLLVFLAAAPVLRVMRRHEKGALIVGIVFAATIFTVAFYSGPLLQSLLLNVGVGVLLIVSLDLNIARWLDAVAHANHSAHRRLQKAAELIKSAESTLDYKYAVHDHLGLPRPYKFGGISLAKGEHIMPVVAFSSGDATE